MRNIEFEVLCKPVVNYLQKNHNPYSKVIIPVDSCVLLSTELGIHFRKNENAVVNDVPGIDEDETGNERK